MSLEKIISIPGTSGLFKMVAQMRNGGYIVESLSDNKRLPVSSSQRIVMLEDISVYTVDGDIPLNDVFLKMKEHNEECLKVTPQSDPAELKSTLKKAVPQFDEERVHVSDIKKMFAWYAVLKDMVEPDKKEKEEEVSAASDEVVEAKPAKEKKTKAAKAETEDAAPAKTEKKRTTKKKETE